MQENGGAITAGGPGAPWVPPPTPDRQDMLGTLTVRIGRVTGLPARRGTKGGGQPVCPYVHIVTGRQLGKTAAPSSAAAVALSGADEEQRQQQQMVVADGVLTRTFDESITLYGVLSDFITTVRKPTCSVDCVRRPRPLPIHPTSRLHIRKSSDVCVYVGVCSV